MNNPLPTLWKRATTGALLMWTIEVKGNQYRTHSGQQGGAITTTEWTTAKGKNFGKANATTAEEQAYKDALSKWTKKIDREGHKQDLSKVDEITIPSPMLAQNYLDRYEKLDWNAGVYISLKLNGVRCIATRDGLFSRKGSEWVACPHIFKALKPIFDKYPEIKALDGEFFNEDLRQNLGGLISLVSKKAPTEEELKKSAEIVQYHIYDIIDNEMLYLDRLNKVKEIVEWHFTLGPSPLRIVNAYKCENHEYAKQVLEMYEKDGHEGAIIRTNSYYENKRSKNLLKFKTFIEDEFEIIDVIEGDGNLSGKVGAFTLKDFIEGRVFNASPIGSHEYWTQMWNDRDKLIGLTATVKYKELTPLQENKGGVPSFGKVVAIRNYE